MSYVIRRLVYAVLVVWAVITIVFFLSNLIGDPAALMVSPDATPEQIEKVRSELGYDRPVIVRYFEYLGNLLHGDMGVSLWQKEPVLGVILSHLLNTVVLGSIAVGLAFLLSVILGSVAAARPDGIADRIISALSFIAVSTPEFWFGLILISIFAVQLDILPTSGFGGPIYYVLPVLALVGRPTGRLALTIRSALLDELTREHVSTGLAKGLRPSVVLVRHGLRNSLLTAITIGGDEVAGIIGGAVTVETIFAWPGIGRLALDAITNRDLPLVLGIAVTTATLVVAINVLLDFSYAVLDPRIRRRSRHA